MVLQKRLDYGFTGYQVPAIPRASRSARGKGFIKKKLEDFIKKKVEDHQMCAFELLATVAGELQERENFTHSNVTPGITEVVISKNVIKHEQQDKEIPLKVEPCDQGSCDEGVFASDVRLQRPSTNYTSKEYFNAQNDAALGPSSRVTKSDRLGMFSCAEESTIGRSNNGFGNFLGTIHGTFNAERGSPGHAESHEGKIEDEIERHLEAEQHRIGSMINGSVPDMCSTEDPMDTKPPALVSSDSSVEVFLCKNHIPCSSFPKCRDDMKVVSRDDDENSSGCTQPSILTLNAYRPPRHGDRKKRKLLASRFWKAAPRSFKDGELSNTDVGVKPVFRNRKMCYTRQRTQRFYSFKRRKLFDRSSISTSDEGISSEGVSNSPEKASGTSSSSAGQKPFFKSEDAHVKLSIKSFRVPELFIEIPETATVGSLKKTVMEAVTAILGGGLRVGVLLQGKKVRDDSKTLQQTGISHSDKLDSIGFTLEPNPTHAPSHQCPEDPHFLPPSDATQPLPRNLAVPASGPAASNASIDPPLTTAGNFVESDYDSVPSLTDLSLEKTEPNSRALVAIPAMSLEALAVVPLHRKSRGSELVQRRIRRPFSVSEVEALVQAVEKLGTGRWRDVKLCAFDNAKHRTYVDLKDKWKTLVHTARISPQQRRGEPVPQELLDRVLSAHAYWSQQQAKQQIKQHSDTCLLL